SGDGFQHVRDVAFAIGSGKDDDGSLHCAPLRLGGPPAPTPNSSLASCPGCIIKRSPFDLVSIILDDRVREKFAAHALYRLTGSRLAARGELHFDELALPHGLNPADPECADGVLDSLTLRVENPVLQCDDDTCFHFTSER